jgi:EmrB/QacA subfamily drug resistance transporter
MSRTEPVPTAGSAPVAPSRTAHPEHHGGHHSSPSPSGAPPVAPSGAPPDTGPRRSWAVLALALTAQVLVVLDISVVNTALPSIGRSLRLESSDLHWLVTAYLLLSGGGLLLGGRIADLLPRRRVFLTGMTLFTVASLLSGFADGATELIAARAGQGLGAALMTPAALSIIMTTYSGAQRTRGLALWGAVGSLAIAGGVLLGGALTTWGGWQSVFWINVPIGAIALVVGWTILPKDTTGRADLRQFDVPGAATVIGGLTAVMFALGGTSAHGWLSARTLVALVASGVLLTAFVLIEQRAARPLVPPHTWKVATLVSGTTVLLGVTGLLVGSVFLCSVFFQTVLGYSALQAGVAFLPLALAITVGTHVAGRLAARLAPRAIAALGLAVTATGAALLSTASGNARFAPDLLPGLLVLGVGVGMVFVAVSVSAMDGIPAQHAGMASGFLMTGHEIGAALGVAVLSAVAATAGSLTSPAGVAAGFSRGFVAAAAIAVVALVVAWVRMPSTRVAGGGGQLHMH